MVTKKLKPAEKRRMREQLEQTVREIAWLQELAERHAGSRIGRDAEAKAQKLLTQPRQSIVIGPRSTGIPNALRTDKGTK